MPPLTPGMLARGISATNSEIQDKLVELSNGTEGTPSGDSGLIIERGSSANVFIGWDESTDKVTVATTSATGASTGDLSFTANADFACAAITTSGNASVTGDLTVDKNFTGTTTATTKGAHIDFDATGITASGQTATNIGLDLDINSDSPTMVGAVNNTGIDVDLVAGTSGAQTNIGLDVAVSGADTNYAAVLNGGNVGIGDSTPGTLLQLAGADAYLTLKNTTAENSAGGAETKIIFEDHGNNALGQIEVSHVGSSDDEKGQLILKTNNDSGLQTALTISEAQKASFAGDVDITGGLSFDGGTAVTSIDTDISSVSASDDTLASAKAIKTYIDSTVTAQDLDATTDSGTIDIDLDSETLTIAGGTGIDTSATGTTITVAVDLSDVMTNGSDNRIVTATGTDAMNAEANLSFDGSTLAVTGDVTVSGGDVTFGAVASSVAVASTAHNTVGAAFTVSSGSPVAGTTNNIAGGALTLKGGQGKGTGAGGDIIFQTANAAVGSAHTLNSYATALTISDDLSATFAGNTTVGDGKLILNATAVGATAAEINAACDASARTADAVDVGADHFLFCDGAATGATKVEAIADLMTAVAGTSSATGLGASSGVLGVVDLHPVGVDGSANQLLTDDGDGTVTSEANLSFTGNTLTVGAAGNTDATVLTTITNTGTNVGKNLTISAGSTTTNGNNLAGGDLILKSGGGDGTGTSSVQFFSKESAVDATAMSLQLNGGAASILKLGSGAEKDIMMTFDGHAQDFRIGLDDGTDQLEIGHGATHGTNTALTVNNSGQLTTLNVPAAAVAVASDHIVFLDGGATGAPKAESLADLITGVAGVQATTGLVASSGTLVLTDLHPVGVSGSANQLLTDDGDGTVTSESGLSYDGSTLAVTGDVTVSGGDVTFGAVASSMSVAATAHNTIGADLTVASGSTTAGTTNDVAGGDLILQAGQGKGDKSSDIIFKVATKGGSGSSLNNLVTYMTIDADNERIKIDKNLRLAGTKKLQFNDGNNYIYQDSGDVELKANAALTLTASGGVTTSHDLNVNGGDLQLLTAAAEATANIGCITNTGTNHGHNLVISAGSTTTGANNLNGGDLTLQAGAGDGTGTSEIIFMTKINGTDAVGERLRIDLEGALEANYATANAFGAGVSSATSKLCKISKINGEIVTTILIDITDLASQNSANLVIGDGSGDATLTQLTSTKNGFIYRVEMMCIEAPASSGSVVSNINLVADSTARASGHDFASTGTELSAVVAGGNWAQGHFEKSTNGPVGAALTSGLHNYHLHLVAGTGGGGTGTYNAGKFVIKLYGAAF